MKFLSFTCREGIVFVGLFLVCFLKSNVPSTKHFENEDTPPSPLPRYHTHPPALEKSFLGTKIS